MDFFAHFRIFIWAIFDGRLVGKYFRGAIFDGLLRQLPNFSLGNLRRTSVGNFFRGAILDGLLRPLPNFSLGNL